MDGRGRSAWLAPQDRETAAKRRKSLAACEQAERIDPLDVVLADAAAIPGRSRTELKSTDAKRPSSIGSSLLPKARTEHAAATERKDPPSIRGA